MIHIIIAIDETKQPILEASAKTPNGQPPTAREKVFVERLQQFLVGFKWEENQTAVVIDRPGKKE